MHSVTSQDNLVWEPLVDSFGRPHTYLRVSLTDRCNFRCQYCMPAEGILWRPRAEILTFEEIERLVQIFARMGVEKVRLTGGEPTLRKGLPDLIGRLRGTPGIQSVLLTTNATRLSETAVALAAAGLSGINISLDTLKRDRFHEITRRDALDEVLAGIDAAVSAKIPAIKLNVVALAGFNDDELIDFVEFVRDRPIQVRFIEFMPFLGNGWKVDRVLSYQEMRTTIESRFKLKPLAGHPSNVAKDFAIEGALGTVGFVTSVTESFCDGCNRIRLTADGKVKTCLFLPSQTSLRDLMRSGAADEDLASAIRADLKTKWAGHPPMDRWKQLDSLSMMEIGG